MTSMSDEGILRKPHLQGEQATVAFCRSHADAAFEAEDYLHSLSDSDRKKFEVRFERLANVWFLLTSGHGKDSKAKGRQRQVEHALKIRTEFLYSLEKRKQL
jgi:hypothetical protein